MVERQANDGSEPTLEPSATLTDEASRLADEAARWFAEARAVANARHEPGQRERYRALLAAAIDHGLRSLTTGARATLVQAYAAKAEDALHGAGQLSLSAQRAPTRAACDDGWERVSEIVSGAAEAARAAEMVASELALELPGSAAARRAEAAAGRARAAAHAARQLVERRNHAYTFHTASSFSFGEGWYLAAAAVLEGVTIQIDPRQDGVVQAETFLRDVGLRDQLQPYRSRPRAMKQVTEIVGQAFRGDPASAQQRLRAAFLGSEPVATDVSQWIDRKLEGAPDGKKVLVWIRDGAHHPGRNTAFSELVELTERTRRAALTPILIGDALRGGEVPTGAIDMILFWKDPIFRQADTRRAQLQFFEHLRAAHALVGQLGVTTAGMDGPALMGLPTLYLTDAANVRMREWVGAVPGYQELVREPGYLEAVSSTLLEWAREP